MAEIVRLYHVDLLAVCPIDDLTLAEIAKRYGEGHYLMLTREGPREIEIRKIKFDKEIE